MSTLVAGVDSSTQSTKVVVCDAATGAVVREGRAAHPDGSEVDPEHWWRAWREATADGLLDGVEAVAVAGQQHGLVALDEHRSVVRPALLWNDTRSAGAALDLVEEVGGPQAYADAAGSVPSASFTVTKLRWLARHEPDAAQRVRSVLLPHDWLTARLLGDGDLAGVPLVTDRGDASGTGYWSPAQGRYRTDLLATALDRSGTAGLPDLPDVLGPAQAAGRTPSGLLVAPGTGDNMGAALGLALGPGDLVVSLGTSGTVFGVAEHPTADPTGIVAGFADATGRFLPLVCTLNAARVLTAAAAMLGTDLAGLERLALAAEPGAGGLTLLPYLDGERTPVLPEATGTLGGLTRDNATPGNLARAAVEGMLCGLADGLDALREQGVAVRRVLLIGGAARSAAVQAVAAGLFGAPVEVPEPGEYVALGAARQAAWVLSGEAQPPRWDVATSALPREEDDWAAPLRASYGALRRQVHGV
ncbi:xylulokinase [Lapillicoccus jejuensis]|uniref:Xylulose kinase n=1 Tax=Lapillicoccus jejuensis TaxID=402171 RepID=A0A542E318_9MICO|nr:xylulokinase [Lapillicoccus jejuensis]TQJ09689.1 xylulokinase [Lapillicoccus jejuensis]